MLCAIPIEIAARELDGVLYLALHLAGHGLPTLLGERMVNQYVLSSGKPVVYFDSDQDLSVNKAVLAAGGAVINLNAEGLNLLDTPQNVPHFLEIAPAVSRICAWGRKQAALLQANLPAESADLVAVTGYPSFDLARGEFLPYYAREEIVRAHGDDYILINTNFTCNHVMGYDRYIRMLGRMREWQIYNDEEFVEFKRRVAAYQARLLEPFTELARFLALRFPARHVIIRPHPVESLGFYRTRTRDLPNIFVERSGSVRSWIASAGVVIHHDCTTGMEALLMGKPLLRFRPVYDQELAAPIMRDLGIETRTPEDVAELLRADIPTTELETQHALLEPYFANLDGSASPRIAELAAGFSPSGETWLPRPLGPWDSLKCWRKYASKLLRARQPGPNGRKVRYALEKFPRTQVAAIRDRLDRLRAIKPDLPPVRVESLTLNTFLVQPEAA